MQTIVGVRFKKAGKIYYFSPGEYELVLGDDVIVETVRARRLGGARGGGKRLSSLEDRAAQGDGAGSS